MARTSSSSKSGPSLFDWSVLVRLVPTIVTPDATVAPSGPGATLRYCQTEPSVRQTGEITTYLEGSMPSDRVSTPSISLTVS